jgi:hypothetical protein
VPITLSKKWILETETKIKEASAMYKSILDRDILNPSSM